MIHYTPRGPNVPRQRQHFSLRTNAERISIKFVGSNHYHHQMNWLYFGWNCTRDKGAGLYDKKFEFTSHLCCHVANDFINFTVPYILRHKFSKIRIHRHFHCSVIVILFCILFLFSFSMLHVLWLKVYCVICISVI